MSVEPAVPEEARVPEGSGASQTEMNVALRVEYEMRSRGWSQEKLSKEMAEAGYPIHQSSISKIINPRGKRRTISVDEAVAFAKVFGTALNDLLLPLEVAQSQEVHMLVELVSKTLNAKYEEVEEELNAWDQLRDLLSDQQVYRNYARWLQEVKKMSKGEAEQALYSWEHRARLVERHYTETLLNAQKETDKKIRADFDGPVARLASLVHARRGVLAMAAVEPTREGIHSWIRAHARHMVDARVADVAHRLLDLKSADEAITDEVLAECMAPIEEQISKIAAMVPLTLDDELQQLAAKAAPLYWNHGPVQDIANQLGVSLNRLIEALQRGALLETDREGS